ncbi:MAG: PAS domain S-box protein, partial [Burkholderiales bacterium]|nr:PAS domain S-box protein [Burkholderiales bacterium]
PTAGWYMAIEFPTSEVLAPVEHLESRLLQATLLLSILLGALTWWMLKRQLSPMLEAIDTLSTLRTGTQPIQALPVSQPDEIGNLIACFNSLLVALAEREQALASSEAFKLAVLNSMTTEICVLDASGVIVATNAAWQQFGTHNGHTALASPPSCGQHIGVGANYLSACSPQSNVDDVAQRIQAVLSGQSPGFELEYPCHGPDTQRWFSMAVTPLHLPEGGAVITHTDITERKHTEDKLRIAATAFESENAVMVTDARSIILQVNRAFTRFTGYTPSEVLGRTPKMLQSGQHDASFYSRLWGAINASGRWHGEVWDTSKTGDPVPFGLSISAVKDAEGGITNYVGTLYDISERKNAEAALITLNAELTHSRQRLRELAAQTEGLREEERKHIAREVHDELGQLLTALRMDIAMLVPLYGAQCPTLQPKVHEMKALVDKAIQGVRNVVMNLRPAVLDLGLMPALEWLCDEFSQRSHLVCTLDHDEADLVLDEARTMVLFRIAQESLTNVSRYARATRVSISCRQQDDHLHMEVRDNGQGFDVAAATRKQSFGLLGMQERALALKGRVDLSSTLGQGTVVSVSIPLHADHMNEDAT